jgi:hypothetical protein
MSHTQRGDGKISLSYLSHAGEEPKRKVDNRASERPSRAVLADRIDLLTDRALMGRPAWFLSV